MMTITRLVLIGAMILLVSLAPPAAGGTAERMAGHWVWKVDGRNFLVLRIEAGRDGSLHGAMTRPRAFNLDQNLTVSGILMPATVHILSEMRFAGPVLYATSTGGSETAVRMRWVLSLDGPDRLHIRPLGVQGIHALLLRRASSTASVAPSWESGGTLRGEAAPTAAARYARAASSVTPPPTSLRLDTFYRKYVDAAGIPIIGSADVPDSALLIARDIVTALTAHRSDLRRDLVRDGTRVGVIAAGESITDLPEHREWRRPARDDPRLTACERTEYDQRIGNLTDREYWDRRSRGTGGTFTTVGAENLLAAGGARYFGENILIHEFSHAILSAIERVDPALFGRVQAAYRNALASGRWRGDYAEVTVQEYWAEGTQFWFDTNMISRLDDGTILSPDDLRRYDPQLASVLQAVYGTRHHVPADAFHRHLARLDVPLGRRSADC